MTDRPIDFPLIAEFGGEDRSGEDLFSVAESPFIHHGQVVARAQIQGKIDFIRKNFSKLQDRLLGQAGIFPGLKQGTFDHTVGSDLSILHRVSDELGLELLAFSRDMERFEGVDVTDELCDPSSVTHLDPKLVAGLDVAEVALVIADLGNCLEILPRQLEAFEDARQGVAAIDGQGNPVRIRERIISSRERECAILAQKLHGVVSPVVAENARQGLFGQTQDAGGLFWGQGRR